MRNDSHFGRKKKERHFVFRYFVMMKEVVERVTTLCRLAPSFVVVLVSVCIGRRSKRLGMREGNNA
jgi:hypothetical protein